jgi:hypothetical protein
MHPSRRTCLTVAAMALAGSLAAQPSPRRYVVASFVGDKLDIVGAAMQTGSRLDNNSRKDVRDSEAALDKVVLAAVADAIERADRGAPVSLLSVPPSRLHDNPESMLQADGVALPGAVVDVIDKQKATHVLLVTKLGGDAAFAVQNTTIGSGKVRGLGFYVDAQRPIKDVDTGRTSRGFLGPFAYVRLSLVDAATGKVMREKLVRGSEMVLSTSADQAASPWLALSAHEKVDRLSALVRREVGTAAESLIADR